MEVISFDQTFYEIPKQDNPFYDDSKQDCIMICTGKNNDCIEVIYCKHSNGNSKHNVVCVFYEIENAEIFADAFISNASKK